MFSLQKCLFENYIYKNERTFYIKTDEYLKIDQHDFDNIYDCK